MVLVAKKKRQTAFGDQLRQFREKAGLTQKQLAERAGVQRVSVIRYEAGDSEPSWSLVCELAAILGVTPNDFKSD